MAKSTSVRIIFFVVVLLSVGCTSIGGGVTALRGGSHEAVIPVNEQVNLAEDAVALVAERYPSAGTIFQFQPVGPLGYLIASGLRDLGYVLSEGPVGSALVYTLDSHESYGVHLSIQMGDWRVARLYRHGGHGRLRALDRAPIGLSEPSSSVRGAALRLEEELREKLVTQGASKRSEMRSVDLTFALQEPDLVTRWAVQVLAGQQIRQLEMVKAQLARSGYRAEIVEKPWLGFHAVQIRGLQNRREAESVLQVQRAGEFKDAFLVEYEEKMRVADVSTFLGRGTNVAESGAGKKCEKVEINAGSLRENVRRLLDQCGYAIGSWQLGADGYVEDWMIQRPYAVVVRHGLSGVLALLKHNYFVEGRVRPFTQTIDFRSAEGLL